VTWPSPLWPEVVACLSMGLGGKTPAKLFSSVNQPGVRLSASFLSAVHSSMGRGGKTPRQNLHFHHRLLELAALPWATLGSGAVAQGVGESINFLLPFTFYRRSHGFNM